MRWVRRILLVALLVALPAGVHLLITRNSQAIAVDLLALRFESVQLWLALLCSFLAGLGVATAVALLRGARLRLVTRRYRKAARDLESEVHELRNLPLSGADRDVGGQHERVEPLGGLERGA